MLDSILRPKAWKFVALPSELSSQPVNAQNFLTSFERDPCWTLFTHSCPICSQIQPPNVGEMTYYGKALTPLVDKTVWCPQEQSYHGNGFLVHPAVGPVSEWGVSGRTWFSMNGVGGWWENSESTVSKVSWVGRASDLWSKARRSPAPSRLFLRASSSTAVLLRNCVLSLKMQ